MSDELRDLLGDLSAYLDQQRQRGSVFFLDEGKPAEEPGEPAEVTVAAEETSVKVDEPVVVQEVKPVPQSVPNSAPKPAPPSVRESKFQQEFAGFLTDTLGLIDRENGESPAPASSVPTEEKGAALEAIAAEVMACVGCELHSGRTRAVPGAGNPDAGLVLIGEAPGQAEDRQGLPFVGPSGQLLTDILKAIGFARDEVYICNILKCRPPGNRDPEGSEVQACEPYLKRQLAVIQPQVILCLGRIAAQTLLNTSASLGQLRQAVHFYAGVPVMATYHPAALLRNPGNKRATWDDVRKVRALHDALAAREGQA